MTAPATSTGSPAAPADVVVAPRYEILPFRASLEQAQQVPPPVRLTVTVSPKHGVDRSLEHAVRLRALGHEVSLHVAARMVRGESHLDEILERAAAAGVDDLFVVGGDAPEPLGPYAESLPVLELIARHALRPPRLGIAAYPEGHPLIPPDVLDGALAAKAPLADYLVTQLCFDASTLLRWLEATRAGGVDRPVFAGAVAAVERRRLLELSTRIGVGPSLRFLRKQRGLMTLFRKPSDTAIAFHDAVAPHVGDGRYGIAGFHFFTFNDLLGTLRWYEERR